MKKEYYRFPCGCAFPVKGTNPQTGKPMLEFNLKEDFNESCQTTWELFHKGLTVGVFQLETPLGRKWAKEMRPNRIEDLEALTAILRPGCLEAKDEHNVSLTDHYCRRKNGLEEPTVEFPEIADILRETFQILVYQEQQIFIAEKLAGFNKTEADSKIRKGVAKKDPKLLSKIEDDFITGCKKIGMVTEEQAKKIFGWIKAGARYSFNRCLSLDTLVETPAGFKMLEELEIGDSVKCPDGTFAKVTNKYPGATELFKVTLESGKEIKCSMRHKFKCQDGEVRPLIDIILERVGIISERIIGIESIGEQKCLDIEIDHPRHLFLANGIVTHNSHSSSYGIRCYQTAYLKVHFPASFYKAKLKGSQNKQDAADKVSDLVNDAKLFNIEILPPKLSDNQNNFYITENIIRFGLQNVKGIGDSSYEKISSSISELEKELNKKLGECSLDEILIYLLTAKLSDSLVVKLIESGSLDYLKVNRRYLLDTFDLLSKYKTTESKSKDRMGQSENKLLIELAKQGKHTDIVSLVESSLKLIKDGGCFFSQSRLDEVREELKFYKMNGEKRSYDNPLWVAFTEEYLFGAALTCKKIDAYDSSAANMTCKDFSCGKEQDFMVFAVDIDDVKEYTTASGPNEGKKNASIYISDGTGKIRARAWSDTYEEFLELLKPGNSVIIRGERGKKKFSDTLTIKQVMQAVANVI